MLPIPATRRDVLPIIAMFVIAWMMGLGMVGAVVGGNLARGKSHREPAAHS